MISYSQAITDGLVGYWPFNGNAVDESGNGYDGTVNGALLATDKDGNPNSAYSFNGGGNRIIIGNMDLLDNSSQLSVCFWAKKDIPNANTLVGAGTSKTDGFWLNWSSNGKIHFGIIDENSMANWFIPDFTSEWVQICGVYDGSEKKMTDRALIYFNGELVQDVVSGSIPQELTSTSNDNFMIGDVNTWNVGSNGSIDEVAVWNRALTAAEIQLLASGSFPISVQGSTGPGGVATNLTLWLKANAGTTGSPKVTAWDDQSGNGNNTTALGNPQLVSNAINYNPAIDFDGTDDFFETVATSLIGNDNPYTKIAVTVLDNTSGAHNVISAGTGGNHAMFFYNATAPILYHNRTRITGPSTTLGKPSIIANRYGVGGPDNFARTNGVSKINNTSFAFTDGGTILVGAFNSSKGSVHDGYIAEAILYRAELSDADLTKIESYLAIKYGITLENTSGGFAGDYQASDATLLWDASANATYHNDVAGIGRDDNSAMDQQKSMSINSDAMVIMDKGAGITSDMDFILWGNDNGDTTLTTTNKHPDFDSRLTREWKVGVNGTPGTVTLRMIFANTGIVSNYGLHMDGDGDFTSGAVNYPASSINGDTITFRNVLFTDGEFFTLSTTDASTTQLVELIYYNENHVGIGTATPDEMLTVNGTIHAKEVRVDMNVPGPDYVFEEGYDLLSLSEIEAYINANNHLPEIPTAAEIEANGLQLGEMNMLLLKKIEELTLHTINQQSLIESLMNRIEKLEINEK